MLCRKCQKEIPDGASFCCWCGAAQATDVRHKSRGNGTGTVYKRGKTWMCKATVGWKEVNGKSVQLRETKGGFATKREALEYLPTLRGDKKQRRTLAEYWAAWESEELEKLSKSKQTAYRIAYKKLGAIVYRDISSIDVMALRRIVSDAANSYYTARDMKTLLKHLYRLAGADQAANASLPDFINLPKLEEAERIPFSNDEIAALWAAYESGDTFVGYILLMIYSGMMPGELLGVKKSMVQGQRIVGAGIKTKERKKTDIVIADFMVPVVASLLEYSTGQKLLTMNKDNFYTAYYAALERCGCQKLPPYSCRHTTATALSVGQNVAPEIIRRVMRWSTARMLDRYAHAAQDDALDAVNRIAPTGDK